MKASTTLGAILLIAGVAGLVFEGIRYTTKDTVVDAGPIEIEAEHTRTIPIAPAVGVIAVVAGIVLVGVGARRSA